MSGAAVGATAFAALHRPGDPLVVPNAWDVASALVFRHAGFAAVGTTSLGVTAAAGLPDGAGWGREQTVALAAQLVGALDVPVTVDLEGGFADDPAVVGALVAELAALGVAGVNLEDGRDDGTLRPPGLHADVVAAAVDAAPGLFVNARTDTHWLAVGPPDERLAAAIDRLVAYRAAGAGGVFLPGLTDVAAIGRVAAAVDAPLNVLWHPGADHAALAAAGVARISTGSGPYRRALGAAVAAVRRARGESIGAGDEPDVAYADLQELIGAAAAGRSPER